MKRVISISFAIIIFAITICTPYTSITSLAVDFDKLKESASDAGNSIKNYIANIDTAKFKSGWDYASKYISPVAAIIFLSIKISAVPKSCTYLLNLIFFIYKE